MLWHASQTWPLRISCVLGHLPGRSGRSEGASGSCSGSRAAPGDPLFAAGAAPGAIPASSTNSEGPKRIRFTRGATAVTVNGELARPEIDRYILTAMAGQSMQVDVNSPGETVVLAVQGEDGMILLNRGTARPPGAVCCQRARTTSSASSAPAPPMAIRSPSSSRYLLNNPG